ncbi:MAG: hypothetical protein IIY49_06745 [Eubacterium sp.]|nr:hypothetical protein [Eubacterium sp.]
MENMEKDIKIVVTDIKADRDRKANIVKYQDILATAFGNYATIKLSLNFFTLKEMVNDIDSERKPEIEGYIKDIETALLDTVLSGKEVGCELIDKISAIRDAVTKKMKIFTSYTDALQIYDHILDRKKPLLTNDLEEYVDTDALAAEMFNFVFADKDKVMVNTKIQEFIAELPVRMTKQRFYDIMSTSLNIYKGGEKSAVRSFADTLLEAALISKPEGFNDLYPDLYKVYEELSHADYKEISAAEFESLTDKMYKASEDINEAVTDYLMLEEVINDALIILYTGNKLKRQYLGEEYETAAIILKKIIEADDIYKAAEEFDPLFVKLEGAQENAYSTLSFIDGKLDEIYKDYRDEFADDKDITDGFSLLLKCDKLTSTSLFIDLEEDVTVILDPTDDEYLAQLKEELFAEFDKRFADISKFEKRSIMSKVLSMMPVFFNTQQEIKDYFEYALSGCGDDSELTACSRIIEGIISGN